MEELLGTLLQCLETAPPQMHQQPPKVPGMRADTGIRIDDPLPAATLLRVAPRRNTLFVVVVLRQEHAPLPEEDRRRTPVRL